MPGESVGTTQGQGKARGRTDCRCQDLIAGKKMPKIEPSTPAHDATQRNAQQSEPGAGAAEYIDRD